MRGYAVIDVETTGLRPSWQDRVVEIGVVHLTTNGDITDEWTTLVNPQRDLGPQHIHGITSADIRHAPTFAAVAGTLMALLRDRVPVAHNLRFDWDFLRSEFERSGALLPYAEGVCTMRESAYHLPGPPRTLAGCCEMAGIALGNHHEALADARAAAGLLRHFLKSGGGPWSTDPTLTWPDLPLNETPLARRGVAAERNVHFLGRLVDRLPRAIAREEADTYLALLDRALLDHRISAAEADSLVGLATHLDLSRGDLDRLHNDYLSALASAARADGVVTPDERHELDLVADLLHLPRARVDLLLAGAAAPAEARERFRLRPGDLVVFTGEMDEGREYWEDRARRASIVPHGNITKKVRLLVAADPDSLSGKARKARAYGIPIVTPEAFARMIIRAAGSPP
ncbi:exonuclease domain-containing protein [Herbidospora mongoliensis]|uniref:exonuclease domain-containing protein n=1 Tax=Herbidospora mongoliensis TaxID=688067 RepID=UPI000830C0F6|nr:exonuclease domain-containing protein [Herbidospora mongoliensis]